MINKFFFYQLQLVVTLISAKNWLLYVNVVLVAETWAHSPSGKTLPNVQGFGPDRLHDEKGWTPTVAGTTRASRVFDLWWFGSWVKYNVYFVRTQFPRAGILSTSATTTRIPCHWLDLGEFGMCLWECMNGMIIIKLHIHYDSGHGWRFLGGNLNQLIGHNEISRSV